LFTDIVGESDYPEKKHVLPLPHRYKVAERCRKHSDNPFIYLTHHAVGMRLSITVGGYFLSNLLCSNTRKYISSFMQSSAVPQLSISVTRRYIYAP
jgi:hypothetical protein